MAGVALITGASGGLGRAIAHRLVRDGFRVGLNDLPSKAGQLEELASELQKQGGEAAICIADVSIDEQVESMVENLAHNLGGLDVMVANAGIAKMIPFLQTTSEEFTASINTNILGVFYCYKYAARKMITLGKGGRLVGASSLVGKQGLPLAAAYSCSKFAVRGLTQSAALEFAKHNITVNAYAPGAIDTPILNCFNDFNAKWAKYPGADEDMKQLMSKIKSPLKPETGSPEFIASLVSFLSSSDARWITGQTISVNGGTYFD